MRKGFVSGFVLAFGGGALVLLLAIVAAAHWSDSGSRSGGAAATSTPSTAPATTPGTVARSRPAAIATAPAFSTAQLAALPTDDWITNGGSLANDRYSPLTQIAAANVKGLKGVWHIHLKGSATAAKYSAESQPIVYRGTMYVSTGADDVFAVDVATGTIRWQYQAHLDPAIATVCCGWLSRGVGLGDGMVFIGQLDGKLVALDQRTGKPVWTTQVVRWQSGSGITAAPLYYDGLVYTGITGGEFGVRGRLTAFDAKTGKERWRFYTIPGPGELGHETWPATNDAWTHGGAPVWQTPSVDPKLGLIFFTTGNASPDVNGHDRAGDNLFTASFVALDARTGRYRWHYQMVHHDIWDFDAPSPTFLFDVDVKGKTVPAIGEAEKTGWLYLLDRRSGRPLYPTPEKPVPQDAYERTARTQPFPSYPPFSAHVAGPKQVAAIRKQLAQSAKSKAAAAKLKFTSGPIYTPQGLGKIVVTAPDASGGTNWQPSSYSPQTRYAYVCSQDGASANSASRIPGFEAGKVFLGSTIAVAGFGTNPGEFSAIDTTSGRIVWQKRWPESCYAGSTVTAGNLVFIGRNGGQLQAYDATTGDLRWSFQTGAGANDAPTVFQQGGKEYVAFYAGGNSLAATPHGDDLWLFALDGKLGPAPPPGKGQGTSHAGEDQAARATGDPTAGKAVFADNCSVCHGASGHGGNGGPDLTSIPSAKNLATVVNQVTKGGAGMPAFAGQLTAEQIQDVAAYVTANITAGNG
jgi:alcohol dehydrogenase (cytochrome c)